jgi:hypothetical protein
MTLRTFPPELGKRVGLGGGERGIGRSRGPIDRTLADAAQNGGHAEQV